MATKDEVPAVLDLLERVMPTEVDRGAIFPGKFRADSPGPVLEALANDRRAEAVGGGLQGHGVGCGEKRIVVFAKADAEAEEFPLDEVMAVEIVGDVERQEGPHTQQHRAQDFVANVEVVMRVATTLRGNEAVVRVRCGELRRADAEAGPQLHALQDEVHAEPLLALHPVQRRPDIVLFPDALLGPFDRDVLVARERIDPAVVLVGPLAQRLFRDRIRPMDIAKEMHDVLRSRQERHVPEDDHAVEAVVYKYHQAAKQLGEGFHRPPPGVFVSATRSSVRRPVEPKFQICLGRFSLDAELGRHIDSLTEAQEAATTIRAAILAGTFRRATDAPPTSPTDGITLDQFAAVYVEGCQCSTAMADH